MECKVVSLDHRQLNKLLGELRLGIKATELEKAYFSDGSIAYCLIANGEPVFAGGVVNLGWDRGEAWILPTKFFREHLRICFKNMIGALPKMAQLGHFKRLQATCAIMLSTNLFDHLGFIYEGTMQHFGPHGETCHMYARLF